MGKDQNDATWQRIQAHPFIRDEDKDEVYRIASAIEVRVLSVYPELDDIGNRPEAWVYPATILLGIVPRRECSVRAFEPEEIERAFVDNLEQWEL